MEERQGSFCNINLYCKHSILIYICRLTHNPERYDSEQLHTTTTSALCATTALLKLLAKTQHSPVTQWDLKFLHVSLKPKLHAASSTYKNANPRLLTAQSLEKNPLRDCPKRKNKIQLTNETSFVETRGNWAFSSRAQPVLYWPKSILPSERFLMRDPTGSAW